MRIKKIKTSRVEGLLIQFQPSHSEQTQFSFFFVLKILIKNMSFFFHFYFHKTTN